jgi:thioester reductase-like protein
MKYLFLTGATGLVGRYLVRELLAAEVPLAVMVRPGKGPATLEGIMRHWEQLAGRSMPRPVVIEGDLRQPEVVIDPAERRWLSEHCDTLLSCAASMTFREDKNGEPFLTNVEGTRNLLAMCRATGIRRIHHVSTAYICGLRQGRILESEIDLGQTLGNVYEKSKLEAEKLIRADDFLLEKTFYRPASVVGDSKTGYVTSFHGFYLPLQLAHAMAGRVPVTQMSERFFAKLGLKGDEGKNLVPVDWLAAAISYLVTHPEHHGQTYHLASPKPVPVSEVQQVVRDAIERHYPKPLAASITEDELKAIEGLFYEYMLIYQSHWRDDPKFDLTNTLAALPHLPCPDMSYEVLMRVSRYPVERNFMHPRHEQFTADFDVASHLDRWLIADHNGCAQAKLPVVGLQVNGPGGGQWQLQLDGEQLWRVERGLPDDESAGFYLSATTFGALAGGTLSVDESINSGLLVVNTAGERLERMVDVLEQVVTRGAGTPRASHVMN